jgi:hypothetical protein
MNRRTFITTAIFSIFGYFVSPIRTVFAWNGKESFNPRCYYGEWIQIRLHDPNCLEKFLQADRWIRNRAQSIIPAPYFNQSVKIIKNRLRDYLEYKTVGWKYVPINPLPEKCKHWLMLKGENGNSEKDVLIILNNNERIFLPYETARERGYIANPFSRWGFVNGYQEKDWKLIRIAKKPEKDDGTLSWKSVNEPTRYRI